MPEQTENPVIVSMTPEAFETLGEGFCGSDLVLKFLKAIQLRMVPPQLVVDQEIPDDAPTEIKNALGKGEGKSWRIAVGHRGHATFLQWYESPEGNFVIVWNMQHPVEVVTEE